MTCTRWILAVAALWTGAGIVGTPGAGTAPRQAPPAEARAHVDAFVQALTSGSADTFEAMARDHFAPEMLNRRTPADRRGLVERLAADFGTITAGRVVADPDGAITIRIKGASGLEGAVELRLEPAAPYRITQIGIEVGDAPSDQAPPAPIAASMAAVEMGRALDAYLAPMAAAGNFAGVVLVAKGGATVYERPFGLADRDLKIPIGAKTRFNIGSINKLFTKTVIAQLLAAGQLSLTDTVGKLLPDYPNPQARPATVDQLLTHRAGIADFFGADFARQPKSHFRSNADYYRYVAPRPLTSAPGTRTEYCNGCYVVLGAIIERVTGTRYEDYVDAHVFRPAGMKGAGFFHSDRFPPDVAVGYTVEAPGATGQLHSNEQMHGAAGSAAGGAYATAGDLLAFDNALRERRLLDAKMTAWVLGSGGAPDSGRAPGGLGVAGGAPGCNAAIESGQEWTVVVVGNLDPPNAVRVAAALNRSLTR